MQLATWDPEANQPLKNMVGWIRHITEYPEAQSFNQIWWYLYLRT